MEKISKSNLFLVASPFQCICMIEAIKYFKIEKFDVLVPFSDEHSLDKIDYLLKVYNIQYDKRKVNHLIFDVAPLFFLKHKYYKNIFIGNLYSESSKSIAYIYGKFGCNLYYLDDGVQVLSFFSIYRRRIRYPFLVKVVIQSYKAISILKCIKRPAFFTIFNVKSTKHTIIRNPFNVLKPKSLGKAMGIYIIGTNSSLLRFRDYSYIDYLNALHNYVLLCYPGEKIFYCPHRRDEHFEEISLVCKELNINLFNTKISVEVDFIENKINPKCVIGFTSNALYTLRILYPNTEISTVAYHLQSKESNLETEIIRQRMSEIGIMTINIL